MIHWEIAGVAASFVRYISKEHGVMSVWRLHVMYKSLKINDINEKCFDVSF